MVVGELPIFQNPGAFPMGWDGEIGHGASSQDTTFSTSKMQLKQLTNDLLNNYILLTTKLDF